ncbi:MAG: hypothetical protein ACPL28_08025 [bacterium]
MKKLNKDELNKKIEEIYLARLRQMTGEERMKRAFELCRFAWKIAEQSIRNEFPNISNEELKKKLQQRISK